MDNNDNDNDNDNDNGVADVPHKNPYDRTSVHSWFFEDVRRNGNVLTQDGITQIAYHQYKAGDYTHLDNLLNPLWTALTDFLPMWMAPNVVTSLGGLACFLSYMATWYYLPQFEERSDQTNSENDTSGVPKALLLFNGIAIILYYTLDCMDGKQARRTGSSSPLGQLFDHGVDCFSTLAHLSAAQSFLMMGPSRDYLWSQFGLQFSFFGPQWEEYYTGTLPHSYGKWLGVTEVNYGLALITICNTLFDFKSFYEQPVQKVLFPIIPISILPEYPASPSLFVTTLNSILRMQLKHLILVSWVLLSTSIVLGCMYRTAKHINKLGETLVAFTKFFSPIMVAAMVLVVTPTEAIHQEARLISLVSGLCICFITLKLIVLSMGHMVYASFQKDIIPLVLVLGFVAWEYDYAPYERRLKPMGLTFLLEGLTLYYLIRITHWTSRAINQLCEKLDVYLFRIKPKET